MFETNGIDGRRDLARTMPRDSSSSRSLARVAGLILIFALGTPLLLSFIAAGAPPRTADFFEYNYNTYVDQGTDYYFGYSDKMISHARYTVQSVSGDLATVRGLGSWTFDGSDGTHQSGVTDVTPVFSVSTRRYVSGIDVNASANATVWFWVSMPLAQGQTLRILDDVFMVISTDATVWNGIIPHRTVQLQASGTYTRDDAYGIYAATYTDRYYFDPDSGYVVAESYEERDTNPSASFRFRAEISLTASSYSVPLDLIPFALVDLGVPAAAVLGRCRDPGSPRVEPPPGRIERFPDGRAYSKGEESGRCRRPHLGRLAFLRAVPRALGRTLRRRARPGCAGPGGPDARRLGPLRSGVRDGQPVRLGRRRRAGPHEAGQDEELLRRCDDSERSLAGQGDRPFRDSPAAQPAAAGVRLDLGPTDDRGRPGRRRRDCTKHVSRERQAVHRVFVPGRRFRLRRSREQSSRWIRVRDRRRHGRASSHPDGRRSISRAGDRDPDHERPSLRTCGARRRPRDSGNLPEEHRIDAGGDPRGLRPLRGDGLLFARPAGGSRGAAEADLMVREAVWVPNDAVRLLRLQRDVEAFGDRRFERFWSADVGGCYVPEILWKLAGRAHGVAVEGVRDDNRSALLPDRRWVIGNS